MASVVGSLVVKVSTDTSKLEQGLNSAQRSVGSFGKAATATGTALTNSITLPLIGIAGAAVMASTALNEKMANVASLGIATDRVLELKSAVQDMAIETGKSTGDLADGVYQVISAFGDNADTLQILRINAMAASAGLATTTDAINLTSAVTKAYGDTSAGAVQKVSDLAFTAVNLGQTTFPELAASMGAVTPLASSLGMKMEELFAVMATATGVTGGTSEVATQLRGSLQALMAPTESMQALMSKLGYASGSAMLQGLGLQGSIAAIVTEAERTGKPLQSYIGSIEGQTLALALAGPLAGNFSKALDAMGNSSGATAKAFEAQTQGVNKLGFQWSQIQAKAEVLAQKLGDALGPSLLMVLDNMTPLIDKAGILVQRFAALDPATQQNVIQFVAAVAAIGPLLMALGSLATATAGVIGGVSSLVGWVGWLVKGLASLVLGPVVAEMGLWTMASTAASAATAALGTAVAFLLSPIGLVLVAVGLLAAAWYFNWGGIREKTQVVIDWLNVQWTNLVAWFEVGLPGAVAGFQTQWAAGWAEIFLDYQRVENLLVAGWTLLKTWVVATLVGAFATLQTAAAAAWMGISTSVSSQVTAITATFQTLYVWVTSTLQSGFTSLKTFLATFTVSNPFAGMMGWLDSIKSNLQWIIDHIPLVGGGGTGGGSSSKSGSRAAVGRAAGAQLAGSGGGNTTINISVHVDRVGSEIDVNAMAYRVADVVRRAMK